MNNIVNIKAAQYEPPVLIHYVQGSTEIPLEFNITDYEIPSGSTARIYIKRPDNTESYNDCTISGNVITYKPTAQFFSVAGICTGQLQVMIGDDFLVTFPLVFDVAENIIDDSAIESSNEYGALESLLQEAQENIPAAGEAAEAANQAAQSAKNAANAANQAAGTASQAATAATNAAGSANTAAGSANKAATAATTAAGSANTAASAANQAKQDADTAAGAANSAASSATTAAGQANNARDAANSAASAANTAAGQANTAKDAANSAASAATTAAGQANTAAGAANTAAGSANSAASAANQAAEDAQEIINTANNRLLPSAIPAENDILIVTAAGVVWGKVIYPNQVTVPGTAGSLMVGSNDYTMTTAEMQQLADALVIE